MVEVTSFKCRACDGTGSPTRRTQKHTKAGDLPVCYCCGGDGTIFREVADTDDRMLHMARIARSYWSGTCRTALPDYLAAKVKWKPNVGKPKPMHKITHIATGSGRTAPRIVIKTKIKPPFDAKKHRSSRHYVGTFD